MEQGFRLLLLQLLYRAFNSSPTVPPRRRRVASHRCNDNSCWQCALTRKRLYFQMAMVVALSVAAMVVLLFVPSEIAKGSAATAIGVLMVSFAASVVRG